MEKEDGRKGEREGKREGRRKDVKKRKGNPALSLQLNMSSIKFRELSQAQEDTLRF